MSIGLIPPPTVNYGDVFLGSYTASGASNIPVVTRNAAGCPGYGGAIFQSDFVVYGVKIVGILPGTDATICELQFSTDGGVSYDSSNIYGWGYTLTLFSGTGGTSGENNNNVGFIQLGGGQLDNDTNYGMNGYLEFYNPLGSIYKQIAGQLVFKDNRDSVSSIRHQGGIYKSATAANAFQLIMSSGTITGQLYMYGKYKG